MSSIVQCVFGGILASEFERFSNFIKKNVEHLSFSVYVTLQQLKQPAAQKCRVGNKMSFEYMW